MWGAGPGAAREFSRSRGGGGGGGGGTPWGGGGGGGGVLQISRVAAVKAKNLLNRIL